MPILFFTFWVLLNSRITVEVAVLGLIISVAMSFFIYRVLGFSFRKELVIWARVPQLAFYLLILLKEIFKANLQIIRIVLARKIDIHPQIVYFQSPVRTDFSKILLIYSIILPPGTLVFTLDGNRYGVHTLEAELAKGINDSHLVQRIRRMEGGHLEEDTVKEDVTVATPNAVKEDVIDV